MAASDYTIRADHTTDATDTIGEGHVAHRDARPSQRRRTAGVLCVVGGVVAVVGSIWSATVDPVVSSAAMSYPFSPTGFRVTEVIWTLTHVLTFCGVLALVRSGAAGRGRLARAGGLVAVVGMALLVPCELAFVSVATSLADSGPATALSTAIGVAAVVAGVGLTLVGIAVVRERRWSGWARWTPLLAGVFDLLVLTAVGPLSGPAFVVGIAGWNVCLALLGLAVVVEA